jgi:hypothetical protein
MDRSPTGILVALALLSLSTFRAWFDYAALTAVFFPQTDQGGNLRFQVPRYGNPPYPFTCAGAALSVLGVAYGIYVQEKTPLSRRYAVILSRVGSGGRGALRGHLEGPNRKVVTRRWR